MRRRRLEHRRGRARWQRVAPARFSLVRHASCRAGRSRAAAPASARTAAIRSAPTTIGVGHRREDPALLALQREDRQVRGDDDQHREQRRPADLRRSPRGSRLRRAVSRRALPRGCDRCRKMFSRTITAPSTMMPKSIAPSDSRLAGMPRSCRPMKVREQRQRNDHRDDGRRRAGCRGTDRAPASPAARLPAGS